MFHIATALIAVYVIFRTVTLLPSSHALRWGVAGFIFLVSQYHFLSRMIFGGWVSPRMPYFLVCAFGCLFATFVLYAIFVLIKDAFLLVIWLLGKVNITVVSGALISRYALWLGPLAFVFALYGLYQAVKIPDVREVEIRSKNIPKALDGLKIVQLTDIHISNLTRKSEINALVMKANALRPDLIVVTGDVVDGRIGRHSDDISPLTELKAPLGVYFTVGNHEYYNGFGEWMRRFGHVGIKFLMNEHVVLPYHKEKIILAGLTDPNAEWFSLPGPDIKEALQDAPKGYVIAIAHQPRLAKESAEAGVHLQFSGHTHGAHLFFLQPIIALFNGGYVSGLYRVNDMNLYVSHGTSLWPGFPVRLGAPSEITLATLRAV